MHACLVVPLLRAAEVCPSLYLRLCLCLCACMRICHTSQCGTALLNYAALSVRVQAPPPLLPLPRKRGNRRKRRGVVAMVVWPSLLLSGLEPPSQGVSFHHLPLVPLSSLDAQRCWVSTVVLSVLRHALSGPLGLSSTTSPQ